MDANKRLRLVEIGYRILPTCATCKYGQFHMDEWGTCGAYNYIHLKHGDLRELSINKSGTCPQHRFDESELRNLHAFEEFIK